MSSPAASFDPFHPPPATGGFRHWLRTLAIGVLALCGIVLATEAGLWAFHEEVPPLYQYDEILGYRPIPNLRGVSRYGTPYAINSDGWRDLQRSEKKPDGVVRIAVLGDELTMGLMVPPDKTFCRVMEAQLNRTKAFGDRKVEVLNFGVENYGLAQRLLTLRHHAWRYDPDIVLLMFSHGIDPMRATRKMWPDRDRPFFLLQDGRLVLENGFRALHERGSERSFLEKYSRIYHLLRRGIEIFEERAVVRPRSGWDPDLYGDPPHIGWEEGWKIAFGITEMMRDEVEDRGARFLVATTTAPIQVHPDRSAVEGFMRKWSVSDLDYPNHKVGAWCREHDILFLDLVTIFRAYARRNNTRLHGGGLGFGDWNITGHEVAGRRLAHWVAKIAP